MKILQSKNKYKDEVVPQMKKEFGYGNDMAVPKIKKVVVNVGTGKISKEDDKVEEVLKFVEEITGQKPVKTLSRKAISGFKIREKQEIGVKVTLRGKRMWDFIDRLVNIALPRTRDFQGIAKKAVDQGGNLSIGIAEHVIFPEIVSEKVKNISSLQVVVVTSAKNKKEGEMLLKLIGFPIK